MAYQHGVYVGELATAVKPTVETAAGIPMIFGTAPAGMVDDPSVNKPVLCYSYTEAVAAFGYVPAETDATSGLKKFKYSICEFIDAAFSKFAISPVIIVNVLDPATHYSTASTTKLTLDASTGSGTIDETGIILSTLTIQSGDTTYKLDTDYVAEFASDGTLVITSLTNGSGAFIMTTGSELTVSASVTDPSKVTSSDIVGGVATDGTKTGLELVEDVFTLFRLVPGTLIAPGFSGNATVAATMATKCQDINGVFKAMCAIDIPTSSVKQYSAVATWKNANNIVDECQIACWPMLQLDDTLYNASTQVACLMAQVDADNGDVPYVSPSNHTLQMTGMALEDGTEVVIGPDNGAYLNSQGIVTALNFLNGWVCWGNRTAIYPSSTDVKDAFIPVRRMFNWVGNTLVQTFWPNVDGPLNRRHVEMVLDSANIWLNGLTARGYILGGKVEFLDADNVTTDLMDGKTVFHVLITPPSPNRVIEFTLEYDVDNLQNLFG